ncbi:MAG: DUF4296 domain-containing protein [Marinilabiliaceae bacterium]|nr:DUF4296 domain-containing protein [Marinilabiliaceae bacterium]
MRKFISVIIIILIFTVSCNRDRVPGYVLSEEEFAHLIADVHKTEAIYGEKRGRYRSLDPEAITYYKSVLNKYNVNKAILDTTFKWYSSHPKIYLKVYDKVIGLLSEGEAIIEDSLRIAEKIKNEEGIVEKKDTFYTIQDIWKGKKTYSITRSDTANSVPFHFTTDSLVGGRLVFSVEYQFKAQDFTRKNELVLIACYSDSTLDTIATDIKKTFSNRTAILSYNLKDSLFLVTLNGYLLKNEAVNKSAVDINSVKLEYVPGFSIKK